MNQVMTHSVEQQVPPIVVHEMEWTPADQAMFEAHAGAVAMDHQVELDPTVELARQQAAEIAASQPHRVTSGTAVGMARITEPGLQLTSIDRSAYIQTQQALSVARQQDDEARRAAHTKKSGVANAEDLQSEYDNEAL